MKVSRRLDCAVGGRSLRDTTLMLGVADLGLAAGEVIESPHAGSLLA